MFAGTITTATVINWATYALARHPQIQQTLRQECIEQAEHIGGQVGQHSSPSDRAKCLFSKALDALPYLDAVVRELIRLYPTVSTSHRECFSTAEVPLKYPVKGKDGKDITIIKIPKGTDILIRELKYKSRCTEHSVPAANYVINTHPLYFGDDALEFRPERFIGKDKQSLHESGLRTAWGPTMSFSGGPRACMCVKIRLPRVDHHLYSAYRFAVLELKAILFTLVRNLSFELPDKAPEPKRSG